MNEVKSIESEAWPEGGFMASLKAKQDEYQRKLARQEAAIIEAPPQAADVVNCTCGRTIILRWPKASLVCFQCHHLWALKDGVWTYGDVTPPRTVLTCDEADGGCGNSFPVYGPSPQRRCFNCGRLWERTATGWRRTPQVGDVTIQGTDVKLNEVVSG